jgi:hypothetical protein
VTAQLSPTDHRTACAQLLRWFADEGRASRAGSQSSDVVATQSAMAVPYPQISDYALPARLDTRPRETNLGGWIYGPETGRPGSKSRPEVIPAITASWSWTGTKPKIQVIVALLVAGDTAQTGLNATAFRFESGDVGTIHDFDHAQPTARNVQRGSYLGGIRLPLHEGVPAVPIDAVGPVGVVMCALLSLYGREKVEKMLSRNPYLRIAVQPYLVELPAFGALYKQRTSPSVSSTASSGSRSSEGVPKPRRPSGAREARRKSRGSK